MTPEQVRARGDAMIYRLTHRPDLDVTGYRMPEQIGDPTIPIDVITFRIVDPADEHEASAALTLSRAAWEAQGSPEELWLRMSAPLPEETPHV